MKKLLLLSLLTLIYHFSFAQKPRARDIGIPFDGTPGKFNAITDVKGVEVGYSTIISGNGKNSRGKSPVRTGFFIFFMIRTDRSSSADFVIRCSMQTSPSFVVE